MKIWRISNYADLLGRGGLAADGRWHVSGQPVVYCADHPSTAMLEILVHIDFEDFPATYQLIEIGIPNQIEPYVPKLPAKWQTDLAVTQQIGSRFLKQNRHAVIAVPSIVMPNTTNYLINPRHPAASGITIRSAIRYPFDSRLLA